MAWSLRMERFLRFLVAGGVALVAGLWLLELFATGSAAWLVGLALVALGVGGLAYGIEQEVEWGGL